MMQPTKPVHQYKFKYTNVTDSYTELEMTFPWCQKAGVREFILFFANSERVECFFSDGM